MKKIICVHLLNDYSGSPNMLKTAIDVFNEEKYEIDLITNKETKGFLSNLNVNYKFVSYNFHPNFLVTLFRLIWFQIQVIFKVIKSYNKEKETIVFINTVYPFGAAIIGRVLGIRVIYYVHESRRLGSFFKRMIFKFSEIFSDFNVFVSKYILEEDKSKTQKSVLYNVLSKEFNERSYKNRKINTDDKTFRVIFLGSLKEFKGINELMLISEQMMNIPELKFLIMLNGKKDEIEAFKEKHEGKRNVEFLSNDQYDVHYVYQRGDLLLNLSNPDAWIETFGLTILEGFTYGIPAIVPYIGGPVEIVDNNKDGFHIDPRNIEQVIEKINYFRLNPSIHMEFSERATLKSKQFNYSKYKKELLDIIQS